MNLIFYACCQAREAVEDLFRSSKIAVLVLSIGISTSVIPNALAQEATTSTIHRLAVGDVLPDFKLLNENGEVVDLSSYRGKRNVVIFCYVKDDAPVCTKESCSFRDSFERFKIANAEVFGISSDSPESHKKFKQTNNLPFDLLSDPDGKIRNSWGLIAENGAFPRFTFVIDKNGTVKKIYESTNEDKKHVVEALGSLGDFSLSAY